MTEPTNTSESSLSAGQNAPSQADGAKEIARVINKHHVVTNKRDGHVLSNAKLTALILSTPPVQAQASEKGQGEETRRLIDIEKASRRWLAFHDENMQLLTSGVVSPTEVKQSVADAIKDVRKALAIPPLVRPDANAEGKVDGGMVEDLLGVCIKYNRGDDFPGYDAEDARKDIRAILSAPSRASTEDQAAQNGGVA